MRGIDREVVETKFEWPIEVEKLPASETVTSRSSLGTWTLDRDAADPAIAFASPAEVAKFLRLLQAFDNNKAIAFSTALRERHSVFSDMVAYPATSDTAGHIFYLSSLWPGWSFLCCRPGQCAS